MWSCDFFLLPYMAITIKLAKSYWCIWYYIPFWLVFWAKFRNVIYVVMWLHPIAIHGNYHQIGQILSIYMMLYTILTGFLSWVQKCHLCSHVTLSYCHIWQLPSNWLNLIDICNVIYYSDRLVELSSEVSSIWSCDCFLLPYKVIIIKLAKSY
jgi:hypothetical protein